MKMYRFDKRARSFHVYQMSSDEDFFYIHPASVILGILGATAAILLLMMLAHWVRFQI
jgi:hypothetical protein